MPLSHAEALNLVGAALIMAIFLVIKTTRQLWRLKALSLWRRACVGFILNDREHLLEEMPKRTPSQHCLCCAIFPSRLTLDDWNIPNKKQILSYMMHTLIMHWFRIKRDIHRTLAQPSLPTVMSSATRWQCWVTIVPKEILIIQNRFLEGNHLLYHIP